MRKRFKIILNDNVNNLLTPTKIWGYFLLIKSIILVTMVVNDGAKVKFSEGNN